MFNTDWDPYEALKTAEHNVGECIRAINHGSEIMKDLAKKYNHQQEVIQQLMFQNNKMQGALNAQRLQMTNILTELNELKHKLQNSPL